MTLLLFDIDGTLMLTGFAGVDAFEHSVKKMYQKSPGSIDFSGGLDSENARAWISGVGENPSSKDLGIFKSYVEQRMPTSLKKCQGDVLPGVFSLLEKLNELNISYGLLTGNWEKTGRMKLDFYGLNHFFKWGAWADDGSTREELVPVALQKAKENGWKKTQNIWIIGDTYRDVETAHANNAKCLAVMTGCHNDKIKQRLVNSKPDVLLENLSDTDRIIDLIS